MVTGTFATTITIAVAVSGGTVTYMSSHMLQAVKMIGILPAPKPTHLNPGVKVGSTFTLNPPSSCMKVGSCTHLHDGWVHEPPMVHVVDSSLCWSEMPYLLCAAWLLPLQS